MLIDDVTIKITAGHGGKGAVAFQKNKLSLGPTGARGGDGGSVSFEGISDLNALHQFRHRKDWRAGDGQDGRSQFRDGKVGENVTLKVPVGTVIHNLDTGHAEEIVRVGERILIAKGGHGGKGNFFFRSPRNTSPKQFQYGLAGDAFNVRLELKLIADIGLIGLPNVGKSALLNELTRAQAKVANYPFTTLEPNLGVYYNIILADIPGLIAGASKGKGLGVKFLRHIERTRILFHLISAESKSPITDYKIIRKELGTYNKALLKKPEYLFLSKSDTVPLADLKKKVAVLSSVGGSASGGKNSKIVRKKILPISIHDWDSLEKVKRLLNKIK